MREDMNKVLVEEPRHGRAQARAIQGSRRKRWNELDPDGEGGPVHVGMRHDGLCWKQFGEHLGPLYRYLRKQVDRPWNKVYGELCAGLDRRNVVQNHLFQHIDNRVALETTLLDGEVFVRSWRGLMRVADSGFTMYVHPRTGILLLNRGRDAAARRRRLERVDKAREIAAVRRTDIPGLGPDRQWHRLEGLWYEVRLQTLQDDARVFDVVLRRLVKPSADRQALEQAYGRSDCIAVSKRQLDSRTLGRHKLR
jgi:hypothetical protein